MSEAALVLRAHPGDRTLADALAWHGRSGLPVFVVADERRGRVAVPPGVRKVVLDDDRLRALGLYPDPAWGWRCGDYALYAVRAAFPEFRHYWLSDSDVRINEAAPGRFFARHAAVEADLLGAGVGPRGEGWGHHKTMVRFLPEVWGCLFAFLRLSGRALDHLLPRRRALHPAWVAANAAGPERKWPNDEAFVASELHAAGFVLADFNGQGGKAYGPGWGYFFPVHPAAPAFRRPDGRLYHPVAADDAAFAARIERSVAVLLDQGRGARQPAGLARSLRTLPLSEGRPAGIDTRPVADAALRALLAATRLPGGAEAAAALAAELFPEPGVPPVIHARVTAPAPANFRISQAGDFPTAAPLALPCLPRGRATAYAADFADRALTFVLTEAGRPPLSGPFHYLDQRAAAQSVARVPFDRLAEAYPEVESDALAPLLVLSPGRCGSTLLSALLGAAGLAAVSEPDVFAQAAGLTGRLPAQAARGAAAAEADAVRVLRATAAALAAVTGTSADRLALKLRSQANGAVEAILAAFPRARFLCIFRSVEPWVRSYVTAFGFEAERLAATLAGALRAADRVGAAGARRALLSYEALTADPAGALAGLADAGFLPAVPDAARLAAVLGTDAQAGTRLSVAERRRRHSGDAEATDARVASVLAAFRSLWRGVRPRAEIARLGLPF